MNEGLSQSAGFVLPLVFAQLGTWYGTAWPFRNTPLILAAFFALQLLSIKYAKRRLARGGSWRAKPECSEGLPVPSPVLSVQSVHYIWLRFGLRFFPEPLILHISPTNLSLAALILQTATDKLFVLSHLSRLGA